MEKICSLKLKKKNMLVLDEALMYKIPEIKKSLELSKTKVMMISKTNSISSASRSFNSKFIQKWNQKEVQSILIGKGI